MWKNLIPFNQSDLNLEFRSKAWVEAKVLKVAFELKGDLSNILLPKPLVNPSRVIGLWESTCFEMFVKNSSGDEYFEFNVSSAYNWNLFYFPSIKARLKEYTNISNLAVSAVKKEDSFCLKFWIALDKFPSGFWESDNMKIGLTAVIENKTGPLSYWALAHKEDKPNFHHMDSFIFEL
ncbi:MAG: hypothetical protein CME70_16260 [Halobacteriovorax sp.]|nr:hypothetical protein [Halobacteriovorax sp.]|tara:strand:+ start:119434 stop:119967 length:534 start_codon:yes stop_codon:yes gene_type:complete